MSVPIRGTAVATFDNTLPVSMIGEYHVTVTVPITRHYGQGNGEPGSGYVGSAIGTKKSGSGAFNFAVDQGGEETKRIIRLGLLRTFTLDFPLGDPNQTDSNFKGIDCHFDTLQFGVDNPDGKFTISGTMTCGDVNGAAFELPDGDG